MNMISEIKESMRDLVAACGVAKDCIFTHAADEVAAHSRGSMPFAVLLTADERFNNDHTAGVRGVRTMPIEVRIYAKNESACMDIVEQLYARLPPRWQYNGTTGEVALMGATHSDHVANVVEYYACFIEVHFIMQVKKIIKS